MPILARMVDIPENLKYHKVNLCLHCCIISEVIVSCKSSHENPNLNMISGKILKPYHFTHQNSHNWRLTGSKQDSVPPSYPQTTNQPLFLNCKYSEEEKKKNHGV